MPRPKIIFKRSNKAINIADYSNPMEAPTVYIVARSPVMQTGLRLMLEAGGVGVAGMAATWREWHESGDEGLLLVAGPSQWEEGLASYGEALARVDGMVLLYQRRPELSLMRALAMPWAVLPQESDIDQLYAAINAVAAGLTSFPAALGELWLLPSVMEEELLEPLTEREQEVLTLLGDGLPNKLIARELSISEHTVKFHLSSIFSKLGVTSRTEAVSKATRTGWLLL